MKNINLIECTLRDGGYYNNWDFDRKLVQDYINSLNSIGIKYVEMGFRSFQSRILKVPIGILRIVTLSHLIFLKELKLELWLTLMKLYLINKN